MSGPTLLQRLLFDLSEPDDVADAQELAKKATRLADLALAGLTGYTKHSTPADGDLELMHEVAFCGRHFAALAQQLSSKETPDPTRPVGPQPARVSVVVPFRRRQESRS